MNSFSKLPKYLIRYNTCTSSFYLWPVSKTVSYCLSGRLSFAPQKLRLLFCEHDGYWYSSSAIVGVMAAAAVAEVFNPFLVLAKLLLIAFIVFGTRCEKVRYSGLIIFGRNSLCFCTCNKSSDLATDWLLGEQFADFDLKEVFISQPQHEFSIFGKLRNSAFGKKGNKSVVLLGKRINFLKRKT